MKEAFRSANRIFFFRNLARDEKIDRVSGRIRVASVQTCILFIKIIYLFQKLPEIL